MIAVSKVCIAVPENWNMTRNPPDISIAQATVPVMNPRCQGERRISTDHTGQRSGTGNPILNWITGHPRMTVSNMNQVL